MLKFLFGKPVSFKTQFFFSLLGLFLAIGTYQVLTGIDQFFNMRSLSLIGRLENVALALLLWSPLVGAIILFRIPLIFRRIAALFLLPVISLLVLLIQEDLSNAVLNFNRSSSLASARDGLLSGLVLLIPCIAIIYYALLLFFSPQEKVLK